VLKRLTAIKYAVIMNIRRLTAISVVIGIYSCLVQGVRDDGEVVHVCVSGCFYYV